MSSTNEFNFINTPLMEEDTEIEVASKSTWPEAYNDEIELSLIPLQDIFDMLPLNSETEAIEPGSGDFNITEMTPAEGTPAAVFDNEESEPESEDETIDMEEENEEQDPPREPSQADIEPWMSPRRAREKQLLLDCQYRIAAKCRKLIKNRDVTIEKLRGRVAKLITRNKCEKLRRKAAEKTINDILKTLE